MSILTPHYGFLKDDQDDSYNVDKVNANLDSIDHAIAGVQNSTNQKADVVHPHEISDVEGLITALSNKAGINSPALTGSPTINGRAIATATPPVWYNLAPASGFTDVVMPKYCKDMMGNVYLQGALKKETSIVADETFLILPAGYQPLNLTPFIIAATTGSNNLPAAGYGYVQTNGIVRFSSGGLRNYFATAGFAFQVVFPVAP